MNKFIKRSELIPLLLIATTLNLQANEFATKEKTSSYKGPISTPFQQISENTRQMSTALNSEGKRVFTAYATKLNASHNVVVHDRNGNIVPLAANVADGTLYHLFDKPLIFAKKPGSDSQYFLITQTSNGASDFLYRHTFDASLPGNGTLAEPLGEIIETNHLLYTNNNAMRYGVSVHAIQNAGASNTTWMYFLRASATQVQLTAHVLNSNGSFGSSVSVAPVNGTPIGKIKFSPDGRQLLFAYLPPAVVNQVQLAVIRRFGIGPNGELSLLDEIAVSETLLDFEFSLDRSYIYYAHTISETPPIYLKASSQAGNKFQIRRMNVITRSDEFIGNSYNDEIFNGKHLALQRSSNGKMYISAAGHRRMMVIDDLDSDTAPVLSGEVIADSDPTKAPYLSGAFSTTAFDHHFHTIHTNGKFYAARNKRQYELKDHLENVNVVVSDLRSADGSANVVSANNYYPYGMMMPGRNYNSADYRYGFNGKEKDDELKGSGNAYDFGARLYDPRVGRWLTRDPLAQEFAGWSDYNAFAGNPILYVDPDGRAPEKYYYYAEAEFQVGAERRATSVLVVGGDDWKDRAEKALRWRFPDASNIEIMKIGGDDLTINQLAEDWDVLKRSAIVIETEVLDDCKAHAAVDDKNKERRHNRRSQAGRLGKPLPGGKWPGGKAFNFATVAVDIVDGKKVSGEEVGVAVALAAMPPIGNIVMLEGDQPSFAADYDLNSRALESLRYHSPQCFDSWFNTFRVHSDYCDNRFEEEKEYVMDHPPGKHWFEVTTETVRAIIKRSKNE